MADPTVAADLAYQSAVAYQTAHFNDDKSATILAICILDIALVVIFISLRLYAQNTIGKIASIDSWLICIAAVSLVTSIRF
jgi:hypothetical protein